MHDLAFGARVRGVRVRLGMRQVDVATRSGLSTSTVSRIERGHLGSLTIDALRSVAKALEIRVDLVPRWRGGDLDRLVNANHSRLAQACIERLRAAGPWEVKPEVSFSIYGERGAIDLLAWHPQRRALLVIELKTAIIDVGELLATLDRKARLADQIGSRFGWVADHVSVALVVADGRTNRRRVASHIDVFRSALPLDGRRLGGWLRRPTGRAAMLAFMPDSHARTLGQPLAVRQRVRGPRAAARRGDPCTKPGVR
ncbi:MAG: XRE family transcriptional regulator [Chloroflexota bacterium]|nr:MAG: XRE family transcriptional regulator [Chloroflexota bacterium]